MPEEPLQTDFDPNDRELCPDGACVGVIGADGRCAECGKSTAPKAPSAGRRSTDEEPPTPVAAAAVKDTPDGPREVEGDDFDPKRRELCPDGACIGVIGSDGRCAECGKSTLGGSRAAAIKSTTPSHDADSDPDAGVDADPDPTVHDGKSAGVSDESSTLDERELCPDGACMGVIGSNGRCKVCGTRAE